ncbi:MAG: hypothetical protein QOG84_424 [Sphingomonadales bacterium]|jgi:hypothetical protein|nr:hypothetical protein [Sphingomonadales bacterium]
MDFFDRVFSLYGTLLANLLLLTGMASTLSGDWCEALECRGGTYPGGVRLIGLQPTYLPQAWRPYVDNSGHYPAEQNAPDCPKPRAGGSGVFVLEAPLPHGFDPEGFPGQKLYACVRVTFDGAVAAARLVAGTGRPALDRALLRKITRGGWRFAVPDGAPDAWQRVRLDAGPPDVQIIPYLRLE